MSNIRKQVLQRVESEKALSPEEESELVNGNSPSDFVLDCNANQERGDGALYAYMNKGKFLYNINTNEWYYWSGHSWKRDIHSYHIDGVEDVALRYMDEVPTIQEKIYKCTDSLKRKILEKQRDAIIKNVAYLRKNNGQDQCIKAAIRHKGELSIKVEGERFDSDPLLLGCRNGVIDLRSGEFRAGRQDDFISLACPTEFKGLDYPAEKWEEALINMHDGDKEMVAFKQRLLGYGISGLTTSSIFPVLWGKGRNGKTVIVEVLKDVFGPLVVPIPAEMLLAHKFGRNSSAPSPDVMCLKGARLAIASEADEQSSFSSSRIKLLSGGDYLSARNPHDKHQSHFKPTHLLILLTNDKPKAPGNDYALWERMHLINFPISFVPNPKHPHERKANEFLLEELKKEAPGILAWHVKGFLDWQQIGFDPPQKVIAATNEYRREEDIVGRFTEECCQIDGNLSVRASDLHNAYQKWHEKNISKYPLNQKRFGRRIGDRFERSRSHGPTKYIGIGLLNDWEVSL